MKPIISVIGYELDGSTECLIPEGVIEIQENAFFKCEDITSIIIPDSVTKIGYNAFGGCINLESVVIKSENMKIGHSAFQNCKGLKNIVFSDGNLQIGASAFARCENLEEIILPQGLIETSDFLFCRCIRLSNIKFPESLKEIGFFSFGKCESLRTVIIPNGVKKIRPLVFSKCKSLESVTIPNSIKEIASDAFANCNNIQNINVSSYNVYNLLTEKAKLVATKSIVKNYYDKTVHYTEEQIQDLKEYIRENRIELFPYAIGNYDLYRFMFYDIDRVYSPEDIEELFNKINSEEYTNFSKIKVNANSFLLNYIRSNNWIGLINSSEELNLDGDEDAKGDKNKLGK